MGSWVISSGLVSNGWTEDESATCVRVAKIFKEMSLRLPFDVLGLGLLLRPILGFLRRSEFS